MPKGPKGQKRPADVVSNAVKVMKIATGEEEEEFDGKDGKDPAAQDRGRKGGKARAESLTAKKRKEIAKKAAANRSWATPCAELCSQNRPETAYFSR